MIENQPEATLSDRPLVFISYSNKDEKWKERLRLYLKPAEQSGRISVWDYQLVEPSGQWNAHLQGAIKKARVAVLLISADYLASEWVTTQEAPQLLKRHEHENLLLFPILIRPCNWMEVDWLVRMRMFPRDGKPLGTRTGGAREKILNELADEIVKLAVKNAVVPKFRSLPTQQDVKAQSTPSVSPTLSGPSPDPFHEGPSYLSSEQSASGPEPAPPGEVSSPPASSYPMDELSRFDLSGEVEEILKLAAKLAVVAAEQPPLLNTDCLVFAMAETGREQARSFKTPHFFWKELSENGTEAYLRDLTYKFPRASYRSTDGAVDSSGMLEEAGAITPNVLAIINRASEILAATLKRPPDIMSGQPGHGISEVFRPGRVSARHLLAALLVYEAESGSSGALYRLRRLVDIQRLRERFFGFIVDSLPDDDHQAWRTVLGLAEAAGGTTEGGTEDINLTGTDEAETEAAPGVNADLQARLAGFLTDYWYGEDLLDITPDVNALASLVAAWSVEPPLSIGLFGDWGSGKTHFMRQMKARVALLSRRARASKKPQNKIGYYKNIVQIEFNAWHYIEGNLWASLVEHIFEHLKLSDKESSTLTDARRDALMEKLGVKKQIQARVDERKEKLSIQEREARGRADEARSQRDNVSHDLRLLRGELKSSVLEQLNLPITFSDEQQKLLKQLGISSASLTSAAEVHKKYVESKSLSQRLRAQWSLFKSDPNQLKRWAVALALLLIPVLVAVVLPLIYQLLRRGDTLPRAYAALASGLSFVLALLASAKPYWEKLREGLNTLKEKHDEIEEERQKLIVGLETEVSALTKEYKDAEREANDIKRQVTELETEIAGTSAGKILAEFIEDRAAASDYRRHLGVLALIRRDFEKLATLFSEQRAEERKGNGVQGDHTINRIILYIDDLDRCPPDRVVQVLQAIHLLLAFPLFVVVVGVDARWVTRSLQESYEWLRMDEEDDAKNDKPAMASKAQGATPHDYLEKIFQIPFWLKPMEDKACKQFLDGLTKDSLIGDEAKPNGHAPAKTEAYTPAGEIKTDDSAAHGAKVDNAEGLPAQEPSPVVTLPTPLEESPAVNTGEAIISLEGLVGSPKVADRKPINAEASGTQGNAAAVEDHGKDEDEEGEDQTIDLEPQSLKLRENEVEYMKELTPLIGRSPRAVKRFLNCYRLIKVGLRTAQLEKFMGEDGQGGEYKAVMILLGIITGAPPISLYFIEELEKLLKSEHVGSLHDFLQRLDKNPEVSQQPDWARVKELLEAHVRREDSMATLETLVAVAPRVSRYSFRVARVEAARQKKSLPGVRKTSPAGENFRAKV